MTRRIVAAAALLCACNELPEVTEVGVHVEVAADPERELCGGTLAHMDELVARAAAELSVAAPTGDDRFRLYWLIDDDFFRRSGCPKFGYACASGGTSYTRSVPVNHELIHNVSGPLGESRSFFVEGLAVAFEGLGDAIMPSVYGPGLGENLPDLDLHELVSITGSRELVERGAYPLAGAFVAFLIRRHGAAAFARAYTAIPYTAIPYTASRSRIDREFREAFGETLDASVAAFEATARGCSRTGFDAKLIECAAPELAWSGDVFVHHRTLACEQADAVGPYIGDSVVVFNTLTIAEAGGYELSVLGEPAGLNEGLLGYVSLVPCTPCGGLEVSGRTGMDPQTRWFEAGRYSLRLRGPAQTVTSIGLKLTRVPDFPPPYNIP